MTGNKPLLMSAFPCYCLHAVKLIYALMHMGEEAGEESVTAGGLETWTEWKGNEANRA